MKLRVDQLHCPAFDSLRGQTLTEQESRGEISKTRLTLLLRALKAGPPKRGGKWDRGPSFCKVIVAITRSFGRHGHRAPCGVYRLLARAGGRDLGSGRSVALDHLIKPGSVRSDVDFADGRGSAE